MQSSDVSSLKKILVENWENAFHVTETSHEIGKRFIMIFRTPVGYIDAFLRSESKK